MHASDRELFSSDSDVCRLRPLTNREKRIDEFLRFVLPGLFFGGMFALLWILIAATAPGPEVPFPNLAGVFINPSHPGIWFSVDKNFFFYLTPLWFPIWILMMFLASKLCGGLEIIYCNECKNQRVVKNIENGKRRKICGTCYHIVSPIDSRDLM